MPRIRYEVTGLPPVDTLRPGQVYEFRFVSAAVHPQYQDTTVTLEYVPADGA